MKQTYLPEHFPQVKQEFDAASLKRKVQAFDNSLKSAKADEDLPARPKLNIPPSKVNELSLGTLSLLNALRLNPPHAFKISEDVLNSVSAREKYQDLIDPSRKLPLPYKYKRLLKLQECIDSIINNASQKKILTTFDTIKSAVENTFSISVELENIQRILYLCPAFYDLSWEVTNGEEKLLISLPGNTPYCPSAIHNRTVALGKELLLITKKFHNSYLAGLPQKVNFDPDFNKTWHSSFNLHEISEIPMLSLPEKNNEESPTVAKVSIAKQIRAARLTNLCKTITEIFSGHRTPSIFLKALIKKVQSEKKKLEDPQLIENDLVEICEILHGWIGIIKTSSGDVVRVNKQVDFSLKSANIKIKQRYN